jgi:hypothetical protein
MKGAHKDVMMMFAKEDLWFYLEHKKTKKTKHKNTQHQFWWVSKFNLLLFSFVTCSYVVLPLVSYLNNLKWEPFNLPILWVTLILSMLHASCEIHLSFETWRKVGKMFYVIKTCNITNQMNTSYDLGANPSLGGIARNVTLLVF